MLSVNKKFANEYFFERLLKRKYPLLIQYKKPDESFRQSFVRMVYYISLIEEKTGIPYIPGSNPKEFYDEYSKPYSSMMGYKSLYIKLLFAAIEYNHLEIVQMIVAKGDFKIKRYEEGFMPIIFNDFNMILEQAARYGHLNIIKYAIENGATDFNTAMYEAAKNDHLEIVQFLYEKGAKNIKSCIEGAASEGYMEIVSFLVKKAQEQGQNLNLVEAMAEAAYGGHLDVLKYLMKQGQWDLHGPLLSAIAGKQLKIVSYLIKQGADNIQEAIDFAEEEKSSKEIIDYLRARLL
jgi:ankyrin repeat protein